MQEEIVATIPQVDGELMLEVALKHDEAGKTLVELRHLVWGRELGWYRQQTLTLDGTTARNLLCRLSSVRQRLRSKDNCRQRDNILSFPCRQAQQRGVEPTSPLRMAEHTKA